MEHIPDSTRVPRLSRKSELPPSPDIDTMMVTESIESHLGDSAVANKEMFLDDIYTFLADVVSADSGDVEDNIKLLRMHSILKFKHGMANDDTTHDTLEFLGIPVITVTVDNDKALPIALNRFDRALFRQQLDILMETFQSISDEGNSRIQQKMAQEKNPLRDLNL
jgi:hypothetical protein